MKQTGVNLRGRVLEEVRDKALRNTPLPKAITDKYDVQIENGHIKFKQKENMGTTKITIPIKDGYIEHTPNTFIKAGIYVESLKRFGKYTYPEGVERNILCVKQTDKELVITLAGYTGSDYDPNKMSYK